MTRPVSERRASIDVGTNSVRLLVGDVHPDGRICALVRRGIVTRLGEGLDATGRISEAPAERTIAAIRAALEEATATGAARVVLAATNALRSAENGPEVAREIERRTGLTVRVLSGEDEARLVYRSIQAGRDPAEPAVVLDIGGGSTEIAAGHGPRLEHALSLDVGCVRLYERAQPWPADGNSAPSYEAARAILGRTLERSAGAFRREFSGVPLRGVGGTLTAFGLLKLDTRQYDPERLEGTILERAELASISRRLQGMGLEERRRWVGEGRADLVPAGAAILEEVVAFFDSSHVEISTRGLRFGLLYEAETPRAGQPSTG